MSGTASDDIRRNVSEAYAEAVKKARSAERGCCGSDTSDAMGWAVEQAGYEGGELDALPADAVESSFGCGNPLAFADVKEGDVVLDLGSGAGLDLLLAARKVGATGRVIGVDMTDELIERARSNVTAAGLQNVEVRKGLIEALPVEDASVDLVISNCVINLSPEKEKVFREIARVLRPGGRVRVSDIVAESLPEAARSSERLYASCIGGAIPEADYLAGLEAAGLTDARVDQRIVYDASQLAGLVGGEEGEGCCGTTAAGGTASSDTISALVGKVWSARVHARKP